MILMKRQNCHKMSHNFSETGFLKSMANCALRIVYKNPVLLTIATRREFRQMCYTVFEDMKFKKNLTVEFK